MPLSPKQRRELAARGNRLKAAVVIRGEDLSDAVVTHVRQAFGERELIKVRINADDRELRAGVARQLAERVPCELVCCVGRVALLHRPEAADGE